MECLQLKHFPPLAKNHYHHNRTTLCMLSLVLEETSRKQNLKIRYISDFNREAQEWSAMLV